MTTVFSNPNNARWGRRLAFALAILGVWLLARGPIVGTDGQHDWKGAAYMTVFLVIIAGVIELWERKKQRPVAPSLDANIARWRCVNPGCGAMNAASVNTCMACGTARPR